MNDRAAAMPGRGATILKETPSGLDCNEVLRHPFEEVVDQTAHTQSCRSCGAMTPATIESPLVDCVLTAVINKWTTDQPNLDHADVVTRGFKMPPFVGRSY